jgi:hypothetical protein
LVRSPEALRADPVTLSGPWAKLHSGVFYYFDSFCVDHRRLTTKQVHLTAKQHKFRNISWNAFALALRIAAIVFEVTERTTSS